MEDRPSPCIECSHSSTGDRMTVLRTINLILITVLSIAAGIPKVMRMTEEVKFFESAGLGTTSVVIFGLVQLVGGALLVFRGTRMWGAAVVALAFLGSAAMLFVAERSRSALSPFCWSSWPRSFSKRAPRRRLIFPARATAWETLVVRSPGPWDASGDRRTRTARSL